MLVELSMRLRLVVTAPYQQLVIIATRRKLLLIGTPLETADLLPMTFESREIIFSLSTVSMQDGLVSRSRTEHLTIPSDAANATIVAVEATNLLLLSDVPVLQLAT